MIKTAVIIVAAGQGVRLGAELPKQYLILGRKSILSHSLEVFLSHIAISDIICVTNPEHEALLHESLSHHKEHNGLIKWTNGGKTRQDSVFNGLLELESANPDYVLIHDAARPFVSHEIIDQVLEGLQASEGALPAFPIADSLKRKSDKGLENVERENLYSAQTPQGFSYDSILNAHKKAQSEQNVSFTDDAALAEWAGLSVSLVTGTKSNFKITTTEDYQMAQKLTARAPEIRMGHGYDVHAFEKGDSVILCGVNIPFDKKLKGHSDADVGMHAVTDALYGAIGEGDIGHHFPPSEEKWKNANSDIFLKHAVDLVSEKGGCVSNIDLTLVCEAPKIGPHRDEMREKLSSITGLDISQISVKATTSEGLGFTGRGEGIAAYATALINMTKA